MDGTGVELTSVWPKLEPDKAAPRRVLRGKLSSPGTRVFTRILVRTGELPVRTYESRDATDDWRLRLDVAPFGPSTIGSRSGIVKPLSDDASVNPHG